MTPEVNQSLSKRWGRYFSPWMWSGKKLATLLFLLSSLVVLSYGGALLEVFSYLQDLREIRSYSRVVHGIDRITADVRRIQSGRSGYLLSGRSAYLVAYTSGIESLFRDTEDLRSLLARTGSVFGQAELDALTSQNGEVLLPMARTLEHRGLMETRAHFLKVEPRDPPARYQPYPSGSPVPVPAYRPDPGAKRTQTPAPDVGTFRPVVRPVLRLFGSDRHPHHQRHLQRQPSGFPPVSRRPPRSSDRVAQPRLRHGRARPMP